MAIIVEHEKRRREILEKSLEIFIEDGFGNVTYQKIADRCGITRTTLYLYFKNKRDIFNFSIKQLLQAVEAGIEIIRNNKESSHTEKLTQVMITIIDHLEKNRLLLTVIFDYIYSLSGTGHDKNNRVKRRTVKLRHILTSMLIEGIKSGEFKQSINIKDANEFLYCFLESAAFKLVILRWENLDQLKEAVKLAVKNLGV